MQERSEKAIVEAIIKRLRAHSGERGWWMKVHGSAVQRAGTPDIIGCFDGRFVGLEVKKPTTRSTVTAIQRSTIEDLLGAGAIATVVTSEDEAVEAVFGSEWMTTGFNAR